MKTVWQGQEIDVNAVAVPVTPDRPSMPDYVRLELEVYPLNVYTLMTPADARKLAHEIYDAAMKADSSQQAAQIELIAFDLDARP